MISLLLYALGGAACGLILWAALAVLDAAIQLLINLTTNTPKGGAR